MLSILKINDCNWKIVILQEKKEKMFFFYSTQQFSLYNADNFLADKLNFSQVHEKKKTKGKILQTHTNVLHITCTF